VGSCDDGAVRGAALLSFAILVLLFMSLPQAQGTPPATPLTLLSREGRRPVQTTIVSGQELIALDEIAALFQVTVREDTLARGLTITYKGRTIVVSADQPMASVSGRAVTLPAPAQRSGRQWLVPVEFLSRALAPIYDSRIDLRRASRLLIVGDLRVPRVTARVDAAGPPTRATIEIAPAAPVTVSTEPGRVVARIDADALDWAGSGDGGGLIQQVRAGDPPTSVAVVTDRGATARVDTTDSNGLTRVLIELAPLAPPAGATAAAPPTESNAGPIPFLAAPRPVLQTIVIDPGHGGDDAGVRGPGGVEEKRIALNIARRLKALVETRMGIRVILTRDDDAMVTLDERAAIANNSKADLFVSLHLNAAPNSAAAGAEVFHLRLDEEGEGARRSAETNAVALRVVGGASRTIDVIRWDLAQARHVDASAVLAEILEESMRARVPMSARPRQNAPLRALAGVDMPAALVEMAYLTNPDQERLAQTEPYQTAVAQAIYDAINRFRSYLEGQGTR
jgi:N-acetylmuramoyl-L-alanine amidase